jgi:hypothetical protein
MTDYSLNSGSVDSKRCDVSMATTQHVTGVCPLTLSHADSAGQVVRGPVKRSLSELLRAASPHVRPTAGAPW